ncbi:hypothetical protein ACJMK2_018165 [Sinanodonta woodiana]|uniref:Uncharacterized protein n=1 Tax=Sinanodonta woodiana TaxID=1069815 RepID=A0ABD3UFM5_SINWO
MRKSDHSRTSTGHIQKACDEWLTTRNKNKIQPQVVPHKKHPSALRYRQNCTASTLILTQSPPPTELKTCTKQSSILSFFQSSGRTNVTDDKGTYESGPHSSTERDELCVSECEDIRSLAGDQDLPLLITGETSLHRSMVYTDVIVHPEPGREDDINIPNPKKRRLHMKTVSSKMFFYQETMGYIASDGSKYYTGIDVPDNDSQSADMDSNGPNNDSHCADINSNGSNNNSKSADIDSNGPNNDSQSADIDSNEPNNDSQSADIDSNGPNNDSQSADIDSNGPNNDSQSADIDSNGPNNDSHCADIDSNGPNNNSQSADIDSNGPNNDSQSADIDSNGPNNDSQSADIDSNGPNNDSQSADNANFDKPISSKSSYGKPEKERLQKNVNRDRTISHFVDTLNNVCDDTPGYFAHFLEGSFSSSKLIANSVNNTNQLELIGSVDSNIHITQANNHSVIDEKCSGSKKYNSSQSNSLSPNWCQLDKVQKRNLSKESENLSDFISDILPQPDSHGGPRTYTEDEFQFESRDSLDKQDSIHLDSEFTLRFQREKFDRRERLSRLVALQPSGSLSSIGFSFENDSQY